MLIFEKDLPKKIDCFKLFDIFCRMAKTINEYYIYELFAGDNKIVLYSIDNSTVDVENCPCGLIYTVEKKANELNIYIMFIATKYKYRSSGYASIFINEFIEYIKMLVNTLGHKVFDEKREFKPIQKQESFFIKAARGADGQGEPTSDGFVVFKNSKAASTIVNSMTPNFIIYRQKLIDEGVLVNKGEYFEFSDDYIFSSPSTAAVMVMGRNANGLTEWKNKDGKTLKDFETSDKTSKA